MLDKMLSMKMQIGRVVRDRGGLVSWLMMHLQARFSSLFAVVLALGVCAGVRMQAQNAGSQTPPAQPQSSSSQSQPTQTPTPQGPDAQNANYGIYIATDPLSNVRYNNRFDMSLGFAYDHIKAGPNALQGANLGGLDLSGSYWLTRRWGVEASGRYYLGTSGVASIGGSNSGNNLVKGPFVSEEFFTGGAEWLGPHNKHGALIAHALVGGAHFDSHTYPQDAEGVGFYNDQTALAAIIGGHMDLNRSEHWVFRITPDAVMTHYGIDYAPNTKQYDVNFAISVGVQYKFTKSKRSTKKENWTSGW